MFTRLFIGILAGLSPPRPQASLALQRIAGVAVVVMLASVPSRAIREERAANFEHLATGVSQWQPAVDGERYREAGAQFSLFPPSRTIMVLPVRSATGSAVTVELRIDSRPIDAIVAPADTWGQFRIQLPESESRYVKVEFRLIDRGPSCQACLWVGKPILTPSNPGRLREQHSAHFPETDEEIKRAYANRNNTSS